MLYIRIALLWAIIGLISVIRGGAPGSVHVRKPASIPSYSALKNQILATLPTLPHNSLKVNVEKFIPADLAPTEDLSLVARKFVDRSLGVIFSSDNFKKSQLGQISESVKENLKTDVSVKSENSKIEHRFKGELLALQSQAKFNYTGFFNADLTVDPLNHAYDMKFKESFANKDLYYQYQITPEELYREVGIAWSW